MITIFTTLKPFRDPLIRTIQENALKSWLLIRPKCEVILMGNDEGTEEAAKKFGVRHIPNIRTDGKLPFIDSLFAEAQKAAKFPLLCCTSGDIIFTSSLLSSVKRVKKTYDTFLAIGQRWDVDIREPISYNGLWEERMKNLIEKKGTLHGLSGIDYFVFPKGTFTHIPHFVVGRAGWDNWIIFSARSRSIPVIDISKTAVVIHQEHDLPGKRESAKRFHDEIAKRNIVLAGGYKNLLTIRDANLVLENGTIKKRLWATLTFLLPWRLVLSWKRTFNQLRNR
ncbi:MAG: hypothetical protein HY001_02780 [Candidatus Portnoybacteria bacterium]|nr:hypothetical protein [Candidatus Portnoybacteria bacterium]